MGIQDIMKFFHEDDEMYRTIKIGDMASQQAQKKILVDGDQYVEKCLSSCFTLLLVGGILEFAETIRIFVRAFRKLGIELVFLFTDSSRKLETEEGKRTWCNIRSRKEKYKMTLLKAFKNQQPLTLGNLPTGTFILQDIHCWVISVLRDMECEVFCPEGNRLTNISSYAQENNCFAILCQTTYLIFFVNLNCLYLSFDCLDLENMTTKLFDRELLATRLGINKIFFPLLASLLGEDNKLNPVEKKFIRRRMCLYISSPPGESRAKLIGDYIRENYDPLNIENVPELLTKHFPVISNRFVKNYLKFRKMFYVTVNCTESTKSDTSILNDWEKIKIKCRKLTSSGKICGRIPLVIEKLFYQQFPSLEDFEDLPPSSLVYRNLRRNMYGILLHEAEDSVENLKVSEWCIEMVDQPDCPVEVSPSSVDPTLHTGLLNLWEDNNQDEVLTDTKWRLFAAAISPELDHRSLRNLPESLVVPVAVLYYLHREESKYFHDSIYYFVTPREIELLLSVAMSIPTTDMTFLRSLPNHNPNIRVIRLSNLFIQGCDIMKMVLQSCGLFLGEINSSICWYFDGKLFQHLYDKSQDDSPVFLASQDKFLEFETIKRLIFQCETPK